MNITDLFKVTSCPKYIVNFDIKKYIFFMITLIVTYVCYVFLAKEANWEHREKSIAVNIDVVNQMILFGTVVFVFGNYSETFSILSASFIPISAVVFGALAELPFMKTSLAGYKNWSISAWAVFGSAFIAIILSAGYIIYNSNKCGNYTTPVAITPAIILIIMIILVILTKNKKEISHPHHYQIGYVLAFMTRFNSPLSKILSGVFLGIFVQGMAMYGPDSIVSTD